MRLFPVSFPDPPLRNETKCSLNELYCLMISWHDLSLLAEDSDFVAGESNSDSDNALE